MEFGAAELCTEFDENRDRYVKHGLAALKMATAVARSLHGDCAELGNTERGRFDLSESNAIYSQNKDISQPSEPCNNTKYI